MKVTPVNKKFGRYNPGDVFDLAPGIGRVLVLANLVAEVADHEGEAEPVKISARTGKPVRAYKRRDMRAED